VGNSNISYLIDSVSQIGTLLIAFIGVWIGLVQLRSAAKDARASRIAEMSWQLYQTYIDPRIREARGVAELIAHTMPVPKNAEEYGQKYAEKEFIVPEPEVPTFDTHMRRLLRFYNQAAVLLEKKLVDDDLVLAFVGPGLKSSWPAIEAAIDWYQQYYSGISGHEKAHRRPIYTAISKLYKRYISWEEKTKFEFVN